MATTQTVQTNTLPASADLSASQFKLGTVDTNGRVVVCSTLGQRADFVIVGKAFAIDQPVECQEGWTKALVGAAGIATAALELTTDALGALKAAVSTNFVCAISLEAGVAGAYASVKFLSSGYPKP